MKPVNWNESEDYNNVFWNQNVRQFWLESEINVSKDISSWNSLSVNEQEVFKKVLAGLTALDTLQANEGMPSILLKTNNLRSKAVLSFMGTMEEIHAKSYSYIFTTLLPSEQTNYLLGDWALSNQYLHYKTQMIQSRYENIQGTDFDNEELYMAHVASVFLESFLFYSGFYYPLYLSGTGRMAASGEIIRLIQRDEAIHGSFVGLKAQEIYETLTLGEKNRVNIRRQDLMYKLMKNEESYTKDIYSKTDRVDEVLDYIRYNANKALQLLGQEAIYEHDEINPIVLNGLNTKNADHDFFSAKSTGYFMPTEGNQELDDSDFDFSF